MGVTLRRSVIILSAVTLAACTIERRTDRNGQAVDVGGRQVIQAEGVARLPVSSSAVRSGDLLLLSGQLGTLPDVDPPTLVDGGIAAETRQAMDNVVSVLAAAGAGPEDVLRCTVFLADMDDHATMNRIYREYFPADPPARSAVAVSGLALDARVEIECIATVPG